MSNAAPLSMTPETRWREFEQSMCNDLNENPGRWLCLVGDKASVARAAPQIDAVCERLTNSPAAATSPFIQSLTTTRAVTFTTARHQLMGEDCLAAHCRSPFFAVVDFTDEDDQYSFILSLPSAQTSHARGECDDTTADEATIEAFLQRVSTDSEPRAQQGMRPTVGGLCPPVHGTLLVKGRLAVAGNMQAMVRNPHDSDCGTVTVFWSDRCPCCPGAVMMVELLVDLIDRVASHHHATAHGSQWDEHDGEGAGHVLSGVPRRRLHYISCNIDDNDYSAADWPRDEDQQVVPTIVAYRPDRLSSDVHRNAHTRDVPSRAPSKVHRAEVVDELTTATTTATSSRAEKTHALPPLHRIRFEGSRTPEELVEFFCRECLPRDCECARHIAGAATHIARGLSGEELMRCLDEKDPVVQLAADSYKRANDAYLTLLGSRADDRSDAEVAADEAILREKTATWSRDVLGAYAAARRSLVDMAEVTKRALARLEGQTGDAAGRRQPLTPDTADADGAKSGSGADQNCCCAYRPALLSQKSSSRNSAAPASPPPDVSAGEARSAIGQRFVELSTQEDAPPSAHPVRSPPPQKRGRDTSISDVSEGIQSAVVDKTS